eukprot:SAG31_NODE_1707_length_7484_cov_8.798104_5_plen_50_part_00
MLDILASGAGFRSAERGGGVDEMEATMERVGAGTAKRHVSCTRLVTVHI